MVSIRSRKRGRHKPYTVDCFYNGGTFYKIGYPEYRYQFYLSNTTASGVKAVTLITWRRPTYAGAPILKNILYLEVFAGAESY